MIMTIMIILQEEAIQYIAVLIPLAESASSFSYLPNYSPKYCLPLWGKHITAVPKASHLQ